MAESIFTSQTPVNTDAFIEGGITLVTLFSAGVNGTITGIRWFFPVTPPSPNPIGLLYAWTGDATPSAALAQETFTVVPSGTWGTVLFDTPVAITAGTFYYAAIWTPNQFVSTIGLFGSGAITNGNLTAPQDDDGIPRKNGRFVTGGAPAYPDTGVGGNGYFVDVLFEAAASPSVSGSGVATLGSLSAFASGGVIHPGTTVGSLGSLDATAVGRVIHPGTALADLGPLNASAVGTATGVVTGAALSDLGRLIATATTPDPPDPDQFVSVLMNKLLECLCTYSQAAEGAPGYCCFRVGTEIVHDAGILEDQCCEGIAYVALGDTYPSSDSFPEADIVRQANAKCAPNTWAQVFQVGIIRCAPVGDEFRGPSCTDWNAAARQNIVDARTLRLVACCMRDFVVTNSDAFLGMSLVIDRQLQGNPQGGCVERTMKLTAQFPNCDC